jgi:hypothetical protein
VQNLTDEFIRNFQHDDLRETKQLLHEQMTTFRQLWFDYQAAHLLLTAEKSVIQQQQEA